MSGYRSFVETPTVSRLPPGAPGTGLRRWCVSALVPPLRWVEVEAHTYQEAERLGRAALRVKYPAAPVPDSERVHVKCISGGKK